MSRRIWLIADDYGLSPAIDDAILALLDAGRLSGTGCMTSFKEWPDAAGRLRDAPPGTAIGLHLTLTDQIAATGRSALAPDGKLPPLSRLAWAAARSASICKAAHLELDNQLERFVAATGRPPDFIDGHQHVHFLPVVRRWLANLDKRLGSAPRPFIRGAPALRHAPRAVLTKGMVTRVLAKGFDDFAQSAGFSVRGPLAGFYAWSKTGAFENAIDAAMAELPDQAIFMCHPGHVDDVLRARDTLLGPREVEFRYLASDGFGRALARSGATLARIEQ